VLKTLRSDPELQQQIDVEFNKVVDAALAKIGVHGIDPSAGYLALAREQVRDPRARFDLGDARHLSVESARHDAVVSALVLNFIPDLPAGMAQMAGAVRAGGMVAGYVWDYAGKMELMRYFWDAAIALKPDDVERDDPAISDLQTGPVEKAV
jgi:trans-aconitate methyltransferase